MTRVFALLLVLVSCSIRPGTDRAALDLEVGLGTSGDTSVVVNDGLAAVRELTSGRLELWAQAPSIAFELDASQAPARTWELVVRNMMPDAQATATVDGAPLPISLIERPIATRARWTFEVPAGARVRIRVASPDADVAEPFTFGVLADVQSALPEVGDIYVRMNGESNVRFILGTGDLTNEGEIEELQEFQTRLEALRVPLYSTIGNHELFDDAFAWRDLFGRANVHFAFKQVRFSLVDSGDGTIDPTVAGWLDGWLEASRESVHVFATHIPLFDPVGTRDGGFASRTEAAALLDRLAKAGVDLTLYGHVHSYYAFENAGIPAYISGGGGALPETFDGIGRHFLEVSVDPATSVRDVSLVRVD